MPALQVLHTDCPKLANRPAEQMIVQIVNPALEKNPLSHGIALVKPPEGHRDPAGHVTHPVAQEVVVLPW